MQNWDKTTVVEWLKKTGKQTLVIRMQGTTLRLTGHSQGLEKVDACSTEIEEVELDVGEPDTTVSLSVHDNTLGLHVLIHDPKTGQTVVSIPTSIPYGLLVLATAEEDKARSIALRGKDQEPEFSPYELLHH